MQYIRNTITNMNAKIIAASSIKDCRVVTAFRFSLIISLPTNGPRDLMHVSRARIFAHYFFSSRGNINAYENIKYRA